MYLVICKGVKVMVFMLMCETQPCLSAAVLRYSKHTLATP